MRQQALLVNFLTKSGLHGFSVFRIGPARHLYCLSESCVVGDGERFLRGTVLYPRRDEATGELRHHIYEDGLFDAIRGRAQTMLGYGARDGVRGERQKIEAVRGTLRDVWSLLAAFGNLEPNERQRVKDAMRRTVVRIGPVRNHAKREARTLVTRGRLVRDSLGRVNPSATRVRLINADDKLSLRLEEIAAITPAVGYYEIVLLNELARIYNIFNEVWRVLTVLVGARGTFATRKTFEPRLVRAIIAQLERCVAEFDTIKVAPFVDQCAQLSRRMREAIDALKTSNIRAAYSTLVVARKLLACMFALREFERIRFRLSCALAAGKADKQKLISEFSEFRGRAAKKLDVGGFSLRRGLSFAFKRVEDGLALEKIDWTEVKADLKCASAVLANMY